MRKNILITGKPKSGKSTLLKKLISGIPNKKGFVTNEMLGESGRVGFEIETSEGNKTTLAHTDFKTPYNVSKYSVDIGNLESILPAVSDFETTDFLYLDEIGQMQLFSEKFKEFVLNYFNSLNVCLASISYIYEDEFTKNLKKRDDVILIEISAEDREEKEKFIAQLLRKIEKAKKYITEPERFTINGDTVQLQSTHDTRTLIFKEGKWNCSCDFSKQYGICSHAIATEEIVKNK